MKSKIFSRIGVFSLSIIIGSLHWIMFSKFGDITWKTYDWVGTYQWFDIIKQSLILGKIPYHAIAYDTKVIGNNIFEGTNGGYDIRWFSGGYAFISPTIILLKYISVENFIALSFVFYYLIGLYGIKKWVIELKLSQEASFFLIIMLSFNGAIISKMGIGHLLYCNAYMIIPLYLYIIYRFTLIDNKNIQSCLKISILFSIFIFFTKLNANGQNVYQFLFIGLIVMLFQPKKLIWYGFSLIHSFFLMSFYIFPTFLYGNYGTVERTIFAGYGFGEDLYFSLEFSETIFKTFYYHFFNIINHIMYALIKPYNASYDASWEFSLYIGKFGLLFITLCLISLYFKNKKYFFKKNYKYILPALVVTVLSVSLLKREIFNSIENIFHITIPKVDRLPSRLIIYPFSLTIIIASLGFDSLFDSIKIKHAKKLKYISLIVISIILFYNSYFWSVHQTEMNYILPQDETRHLFKTTILNLSGDDAYKRTVNISYLVSLTLFSFTLYIYWLLKKNKIFKIKSYVNGK